MTRHAILVSMGSLAFVFASADSAHAQYEYTAYSYSTTGDTYLNRQTGDGNANGVSARNYSYYGKLYSYYAFYYNYYYGSDYGYAYYAYVYDYWAYYYGYLAWAQTNRSNYYNGMLNKYYAQLYAYYSQ